MDQQRVKTMGLKLHLHATEGVFDIQETGRGIAKTSSGRSGGNSGGNSGGGWFGLQFYLQAGDQSLVGTRLQQRRSSSGRMCWRIKLAPGLEAHFEAGRSPAGGGIWIRPSLVNRGQRPFRFDGYGFQVREGAGGPQLAGRGLPVFAHSENLRYENLPQSRQTYPFLRPLPQEPRCFGRQGLGPMPALVIGRTEHDRWLVEGAATQERHAPSWQLGLPAAPGRMLEYRSAFFWNGAAREEVASGQTLALESTFFLLCEAPLDRIYDTYLDELVKLYRQRFAGAHSVLDHRPVYCTWNYGIYTGLSEADCLKRIRLAAKAQKGGIFQIDHGYQPAHPPHLSWGYLDAYYPDTGATWDKTRFPGGPQRFVAECRKAGLTPAIWWTPRMDIGGPISRDHPDWIARNAAGQPIAHVGDLHPDYSVPGVRQFIAKTLRTVIHDWGFAGIKLDFFSWAFDAPDLVYQGGGTHIQWRRWLLNLIRRELGPQGYFLHCVSCPLGNPFLAVDGCDAFRAGTDIDHGGWENHIANCSWLLASLGACGRRTWYADMDSFMGAPQYPDHERRFRCAVGYLTAGMIDISGALEKFTPAMMRDYRRLSQRCDQGGRVLVPDRAAFFGRPLPRILLRLHEPASRTRRQHGIAATVGLFNWDQAPQTLATSLAELGLAGRKLRLRDFWTGRPVALQGGMLAADLPPRGHLLADLYL